MRNGAKLIVRLAIFGLGLLAAIVISSGVGAADTTTTTATTATTPTSPTTTTATETTAPVTTTTTVQITTTTKIVQLPTGTTTTSSSENGTAAWVWALLGILGVALIVLIVVLARRGGGGGAVSLEDRRRQLDAAVGSWTTQGWAIETQTDDSAVLRRAGEAMIVTVDKGGHVSTRPVPGS